MNQAVNDALNSQLTTEYSAIIQYVVHAHMQENWGAGALAKYMMKEAREEMGHAEKIIERIVMLDGTVDVGVTPAPVIGKTFKEQFEADLKGEEEAIARLNSIIEVCVREKDNDSRALAESILHDEEQHRDWLKTQLFQIEQIGAQSYYLAQVRA